MGSPSPSGGRKEVQHQLQGPRPTALKITKDSHKIKKPPVPPPRQPLIIYTVSPKIIHTNPSEFKDLVQRLTGRSAPVSDPDHQHRHRQEESVERVGHFPAGILSPTPSLLPPIPTSIFSPAAAADLSPLTAHFFQDLSPPIGPTTQLLPNNISSLDFFHNLFHDFH